MNKLESLNLEHKVRLEKTVHSGMTLIRLPWRRIPFLLCLVAFLFSASMLFQDITAAVKEEHANRLLARQVRRLRNSRESISAAALLPESTDKENTLLPQYAELYRQNNDLAGWLYIEGTDLDYPVMYTPKEPQYYLHRGFDKDYAASGCLFISEGCAPASPHIIIYGHNMKNGAMFGRLDSYSEIVYAREHPIICFDTLTEEKSYEIWAAFYTEIHVEDAEHAFRYYAYTDLSDRETFEEYVRQVKAASIYDMETEVCCQDRLLTLSTCSYHTENGRFVVVAKEIP